MKRSCIIIQSWHRALLAARKFQSIRRVALFLQRNTRRYLSCIVVATLQSKKMLEKEARVLVSVRQQEVSSLMRDFFIHPFFGDGVEHGRRNDIVYDRICAFFDLRRDVTSFYPKGWLSAISSLAAKLAAKRKDSPRSQPSLSPKTLNSPKSPGNEFFSQPTIGVKRIAMMAIGEAHTVIVDDLSTVYTFGFGDSGQLGHGPKKTDLSVPTEIENFKDTMKSYELSYKTEKISIGRSKLDLPRNSLSYQRM